MSGALVGLRVLDLTQHLSGPYCAMVLADQGADVIKIEKPGKGDDAREMPPFVGGEGSPFMLWNRNKRSVVLDLKTAEGVTLLEKLAVGADVLIENFRPGTMDRLGLGYAHLAALNPRLIYCAISGFGQSGPYSRRGGFDLMIQAMSGLMSVNGEPDGPPLRLPIAISDVAGGLFGAVGILSALAARERSGRGQQVDVSLYESAIAFGVYEAAYVFATGKNPPRLGQAHRGSSPYQVFRSKDGWITVGGATQELWHRLCRVLGCEELILDPRFSDNARRVANNAALVELLAVPLARETNAHWLARLEAAGIPAGPVVTHAELFADPQLRAREGVVEVEHPSAGRMATLGVPIKLSETPGKVRRPAPRLGEHTAEVLAELGREAAE
ncbi:MAG TPA: CoA transferase [Alphaproteobacteria bacterium]|nr:CoA transferase [Alphaproteobacteria bacterium]